MFPSRRHVAETCCMLNTGSTVDPLIHPVSTTEVSFMGFRDPADHTPTVQPPGYTMYQAWKDVPRCGTGYVGVRTFFLRYLTSAECRLPTANTTDSTVAADTSFRYMVLVVASHRLKISGVSSKFHPQGRRDRAPHGEWLFISSSRITSRKIPSGNHKQ